MKRLVALGVSLVLLLGLIGMVGSGAWFSDTVSSTGNALTAATLYLSVNDTRGTTQTYTLNNIKPGAWDLGGQAVLKNTGTIPGHLWYEIVNVSPAGGPLGALVRPSFQENADDWTRFGGDRVINDAVGVRVDVGDLQPGASIPLVVYFVWTPTDGDNAAQGATLTFDVVWHLDQLH